MCKLKVIIFLIAVITATNYTSLISAEESPAVLLDDDFSELRPSDRLSARMVNNA